MSSKHQGIPAFRLYPPSVSTAETQHDRVVGLGNRSPVNDNTPESGTPQPGSPYLRPSRPVPNSAIDGDFDIGYYLTVGKGGSENASVSSSSGYVTPEEPAPLPGKTINLHPEILQARVPMGRSRSVPPKAGKLPRNPEGGAFSARPVRQYLQAHLEDPYETAFEHWAKASEMAGVDLNELYQASQRHDEIDARTQGNQVDELVKAKRHAMYEKEVPPQLSAFLAAQEEKKQLQIALLDTLVGTSLPPNALGTIRAATSQGYHPQTQSRAR